VLWSLLVTIVLQLVLAMVAVLCAAVVDSYHTPPPTIQLVLSIIAP
jgi:hypothetical protein